MSRPRKIKMRITIPVPLCPHIPRFSMWYIIHDKAPYIDRDVGITDWLTEVLNVGASDPIPPERLHGYSRNSPSPLVLACL